MKLLVKKHRVCVGGKEKDSSDNTGWKTRMKKKREFG